MSKERDLSQYIEYKTSRLFRARKVFDVLIVLLGLIFLAANTFMLIRLFSKTDCGATGQYGERICQSEFSGWVILLIMAVSISCHIFILYLLSIIRDLIVVTSVTNNSNVAKTFKDSGLDYLFRDPTQPTSYDVIKERVIAEQEAQKEQTDLESDEKG